jgi:hypothetical protein
MAFDNHSKAVFTAIFGDAVTHGIEVGHQALRIDLVIARPLECPPLLPQWLYQVLGSTTVVEFKSDRDPPTEATLPKLLGYLGFYASQHQISFPQIAATCVGLLVTVKFPSFLDTYVQEGLVYMARRGHYRFSGPQAPRFEVVVINELPVIPENDALLAMSSGPTLRQFLETERRSPTLQKYIFQNVLLHYLEVSDMAQTQEILSDVDPESIRKALEITGIIRVVEALGLDRVIAEVGLDRVIAEVGLDRVIAEVGLDRVIAEVGLDALLDRVDAEDLGNYLARRLKHKQN